MVKYFDRLFNRIHVNKKTFISQNVKGKKADVKCFF